MTDIRGEYLGSADGLDGLVEHVVDVLHLRLALPPHGLLGFLLQLGAALRAHFEIIYRVINSPTNQLGQRIALPGELD